MTGCRNMSRVGIMSMAVAATMLAQSGCKSKSGQTKADPEMFRQHITMLADDRLEGRGVGTPGIEMAAAYIAGQFAEIGILPGGPQGTYYQEFEMALGGKMTDNAEFTLSGVDASAVRNEDYRPFAFSTNDEFEGDIVFVGYGITNEEKNHDDYADIDVEGKVVLMLRREPPGWKEGGGNTRFAQFSTKIYNAKDHGASAVLIVNQESDNDRLMRFTGRGRDFGLPAFHVKRDLANQLLTAGGLDSLSAYQTRLDSGEIASAAVSGVRLKGKAGVESIIAHVRNVVGVIPGEGPLANEYVVVGGHYDHLGNQKPSRMFGSRGEGTGKQIHNGADDNASGTAGVIEVGRMLMNKRPLKRSVILMAFTGEETGLYGSKYYVENPTVPIENIVSMLNMDMIGRFKDDKNRIEIFGTQAADEFEEMLTRLTDDAGMALRGSASAVGPSDHTSFYNKKIPSLHFFTGLHQDYHKPSDDTHKVNFKGTARVVDLVATIAHEIVDTDKRPTYNRVSAPANVGPTRVGLTVRMGVMPGYADSNRVGMAIDGVTDNGPAAKAGMKEGDYIVKIGTSTVKSVQDYMTVLADNSPGDVVDVLVMRDGKEMVIKVKLEGGRAPE